ncbi:hypothetical protein ACOCJ4_08905 [Knoellia sp. CPCC 206435]|uniref:hypothetical protein n=1 Tax=Knoellia terrae TaxID=3404797 RepID=UPI003B42B8B0
MSTVEERTREALQDAVDSLGVTDDDISRMEAELGAALPRTRRPVAPRGTTPARRRWSLAADGEMLAVMYAPAYLEGFAGDRLVSRSGDVYTVSLAQGCTETWRVRGELQLERLSPEPYLAGELSIPPVAETPGFGIEKDVVDGVWLHPGTGTVLAVGRPWGGSVLRYVLDDDGDGASDPDQRGRVTVPDNGVPVFQPDAGEGPRAGLLHQPDEPEGHDDHERARRMPAGTGSPHVGRGHLTGVSPLTSRPAARASGRGRRGRPRRPARRRGRG